jgi:hypothetical protein
MNYVMITVLILINFFDTIHWNYIELEIQSHMLGARLRGKPAGHLSRAPTY